MFYAKGSFHPMQLMQEVRNKCSKNMAEIILEIRS